MTFNDSVRLMAYLAKIANGVLGRCISHDPSTQSHSVQQHCRQICPMANSHWIWFNLWQMLLIPPILSPLSHVSLSVLISNKYCALTLNAV